VNRAAALLIKTLSVMRPLKLEIQNFFQGGTTYDTINCS